MSTSIIITENVSGNLHEAATFINRMDLVDYVIHMDGDGRNSIIVLRMPRSHPYVIKYHRSRLGEVPDDKWGGA